MDERPKKADERAASPDIDPHGSSPVIAPASDGLSRTRTITLQILRFRERGKKQPLGADQASNPLLHAIRLGVGG
jgi:hypothetical protein